MKLDDGFAMHPKVIGLSLAARWAYIHALCYSARYETDGIVPDAVLQTDSGTLAELVDAGLWESGTGSISIHDYLVYNPSRTEREQNRNRTRTKRASREGDGVVAFDVSLDLKSKESAFVAFWAAYPRPVGKPKAREAFYSALQAGSAAADIVAGAERYRDDPNRDETYTAHPTTWLHREGWNDPALPSRRARKRDQAAELLREAMNP